MAQHAAVTRAQSYLKLIRSADSDAERIGHITLAQEQLKDALKSYKKDAGTVPGQKTLEEPQADLPGVDGIDKDGVVLTTADKDAIYDEAKRTDGDVDQIARTTVKCDTCGILHLADSEVGAECGAPVELDGQTGSCLGRLVAVADLLDESTADAEQAQAVAEREPAGVL